MPSAAYLSDLIYCVYRCPLYFASVNIALLTRITFQYIGWQRKMCGNARTMDTSRRCRSRFAHKDKNDGRVIKKLTTLAQN